MMMAQRTVTYFRNKKWDSHNTTHPTLTMNLYFLFHKLPSRVRTVLKSNDKCKFLPCLFILEHIYFFLAAMEENSGCGTGLPSHTLFIPYNQRCDTVDQHAKRSHEIFFKNFHEIIPSSRFVSLQQNYGVCTEAGTNWNG